METKLNSKGKRFFALAIAAGLMLAMALFAGGDYSSSCAKLFGRRMLL
ncbi:MAG: hypothetical protein LBH25_06495 [Fibromonadaceae bacterium]|nr:hypothetical protein [Fibromonadaceae bacterium]